jgi:hypothetical protein
VQPLTVISLTADRPFPVIIETGVTWTALAAGGTFPYTYEFLVFDGSACRHTDTRAVIACGR